MAKPDETSGNAPAPFVSAFNLFTPSIEVLKRNRASYVVFLLIPLLLSIIAGFGINESATSPSEFFTSPLGALLPISSLIMVLTFPSIILVMIRGAQGHATTPDEALGQGLRRLLPMIGLLIVMSIIFVVSFLLLIVPFFFMLRRYILAPYYLMDQKLTIRQALRTSAADSKKYSKAIWGVIGVNVLVSFAALIPLLGVIASPVLQVLYYAAFALRYEQIKAANNGKTPVTPIEKALASNS